MKKIIKNKIFLIVLLCIISCGIGAYAATTYKASDVVYNASDGTSMNVNDALNDLYKNKGSNIKTKRFTTYNISALNTYNDTKWINPDTQNVSCTGSGDNQKCTFSGSTGAFFAQIDLTASKVLGGYICFNASNPTYEAGIRSSRGWSGNTEGSSIQYLYYKDGICIYIDESGEYGQSREYASGNIKYRWNNFKITDSKYGTTFENKVSATIYPSGKITFNFDVDQIPNYNNKYSTGKKGTEYGIMGTQFKMWGYIFYTE